MGELEGKLERSKEQLDMIFQLKRNAKQWRPSLSKMARKDVELLEKEQQVRLIQRELARYRASSARSWCSLPPRMRATPGSTGRKSWSSSLLPRAGARPGGGEELARRTDFDEFVPTRHPDRVNRPGMGGGERAAEHGHHRGHHRGPAAVERRVHAAAVAGQDLFESGDSQPRPCSRRTATPCT